MAKIRHFFCAFLRATGVLVFLLSRCMCGGGVGRDGCVRHRGRHGSRIRNKIFLWARSGVGGGAILSWWICGKHIII